MIFVLAFTEKAHSAQDVFTINVVPELVDSPKLLLLKASDSSPSLVRCDPQEEFTTISIMLDANFLTMEPVKRVDLARKVIGKFGISEVSNRTSVRPLKNTGTMRKLNDVLCQVCCVDIRCR